MLTEFSKRSVSNSPALDEMEAIAREGLRKAKASMAEMEQVLENIQKIRKTSRQGDEPLPSVTPGQYKGMERTAALESYLKARPKHRIPFKQVIEDLLVGGVDPGLPRRKNNDPFKLLAQTIKIAVPNKKKLVCWEPAGLLKGVDVDKITIWLAPTASEPPKPRVRKKG